MFLTITNIFFPICNLEKKVKIQKNSATTSLNCPFSDFIAYCVEYSAHVLVEGSRVLDSIYKRK